jgi:hypothetical protein
MALMMLSASPAGFPRTKCGLVDVEDRLTSLDCASDVRASLRNEITVGKSMVVLVVEGELDDVEWSLVTTMQKLLMGRLKWKLFQDGAAIPYGRPSNPADFSKGC